MDKITLGVIFGIAALLFGGLANALAKRPAVNNNPNKIIFYRNIFNSFLLLIILLFTLNQTTFAFKYILFAVGLSIFGYVPMYYFYKAAAIGKIGIVSPVSSGNTIVALLLAFLFLNERITILQTISIMIVICGIILISIDLKAIKKSEIFKVSSGVPYALIAAVGWGIWYVLAKIPTMALGPFLTSFIIEFISIFVALFLIIKSKDNLKLHSKGTLWQIVPISVCMVLWSLSYYQGIKIANVSVIVTIASASPLVVVLLGKLFYKEKLAAKQYLAILLIIAGILSLALK